MKAKIVQLVDRDWIVSVVDVENIIAAMEVRGAKFTKLSKNYAAVLEQNPQAAVPRPMLWDLPEFDGFAGPMYDKIEGVDAVRYESWKAYDRLSA